MGYKLTNDPTKVVRLTDGLEVTEGTLLWAEYQAWLAAGNTPSPWVPVSVLNWRGQGVLVQRGIYDAVVSAIDAIADPATKKIAQIAFGSADFTRASPLLNSILKSSPINYSDADIDQLFIDASKLSL